MTVELLNTLSLISYIVAGVLLLVSVALFFLLDVPKVYGEISGKTAKKAIDAIQKQNESTQANGYASNNAARSKLTDKISKSGKIKADSGGLPIGVGTEKIAVNQNPAVSKETTVLSSASETTVLSDSSETTVLTSPQSETPPATFGEVANETTVLVSDTPMIGETTVLVENPINTTSVPTVLFEIEAEVNFADSTEVIE